MKLSGIARRVELSPENEEESEACQEMIDQSRAGELMIYWGDKDEGGSGLIINTVEPDRDKIR